MSELQYSKPVRLAGAALHAGLANKWETAARYVERISVECGEEGLGTALMAWCDAYVDHSTGGNPATLRVHMAHMEVESGRLDGDVPDKVLWAGRLVAARAEMDEARFTAVLGELPYDGYEVGRYVLALVESVATTINALPRGYARMGAGTDD